MDDIEKRIRPAAERILGNEALTADLTDEGAAALNGWALAALRAIASEQPPSAAHIQNLQRLMVQVNRWVSARPGVDPSRDRLHLAIILDRAISLYGPAYEAPERARCETFLDALPTRRSAALTQAGLIAALRLLVEPDGPGQSGASDRTAKP